MTIITRNLSTLLGNSFWHHYLEAAYSLTEWTDDWRDLAKASRLITAFSSKIFEDRLRTPGCFVAKDF